MRVRYTPTARADIDDIYRSIAPNNPVAAQQVQDRIRADADDKIRDSSICLGASYGDDSVNE